MNYLKVILLISLISVCWAVFPDYTNADFQNDCLKASNSYRATHHAPPLKVDPSLVEYAKSRCHLVSQYEGLSHGHAGLKEGYGENLFWGGNTDKSLYSGSVAVKSWYDEVASYWYIWPGFSAKTGHFTQLVWKSTTSVGCAICAGQGDEYYETYIVCNYKPPGNMEGEFPDNVLKP